jgi:hypothetical protein
MESATLGWLAFLICCHTASAQSGKPESAPTGPNFSGDYILIRATEDLHGVAPKRVQITQTEKVFTITETNSDGRSKINRFQFSAEFVDDGDKGKAKVWFSWSNRLITERAINVTTGYYRQLDTFSSLGNGNIRLCRDAFWRGEHETESRSGCASYARR